MALPNRRCLHCGAEAPIAAQFCAQCGTGFPPTPPELSPYACEKCETSLPGGSRFCPGCGQAFDEPVPTTTPPNSGFRPQSVPPEPVATALSQPQPIPFLVQPKMPSFSRSGGPKVNYGWISEAWRLFQQKPTVWILCTLAQYLPVVLLYGVALFFGLIGSGGHVSATPYNDPRAYEGGHTGLLLGMIVAFIPAFYLSCRLNYATSMMANKQVRGEAITVSDMFGSGHGIWPIFWLGQLLTLLFFIAALLFYVPVLLLAGLTLPSSSLAAEGVGPIESLRRSVAAMKNDWLNAVGVAVLFLLIVLASAIPCGLGLLVTYPMANLLASFACRDMIGIPHGLSSDSAPAQGSITTPPAYAPKPNIQTEVARPQKPFGAASSVLDNIFATRGMAVGIGSLVAVLCLGAGFWLFHLAHPPAPATALNTSSSVVPVSDNAPNPPDAPTSSGEIAFPVRWGKYTITREDIGGSDVDRQQSVSIRNERGDILWKAEDATINNVQECHILDMKNAELEISTDAGAHYRSGVEYFFSEANGLYLLFTNSSSGDDGFDITGFSKTSQGTRPNMQVTFPILAFDGLPHSAEKWLYCVYRWNGSDYVNITTEFPHDARTAENDAQARYLHHWQENPTADFNGINEDIEGGDSADREDAIGYWANAMVIGDGYTAKDWLLAHASPRLASHLQQIEGDLQKQIPHEGAKLNIEVGDGKNLDQPAAMGASRPSATDDRTASDNAVVSPRSIFPEERDPLRETAAPGSGLTDHLLDLNTLQRRIVSDEDLSGRSLSALSISYNAIYAVHGYVFKRSSLQQLFSQARWYRPNPAFREQNLSDVEKANLKTIRAYERTHYGY